MTTFKSIGLLLAIRNYVCTCKTNTTYPHSFQSLLSQVGVFQYIKISLGTMSLNIFPLSLQPILSYFEENFHLMGIINEPLHKKTNKVTCAPSEDSDQPWNPPSLIRVIAVHMKKLWVLSYPLSAQGRL